MSSLLALGAGHDFKGDLLAFLQRLETFDFDRREVCKEVFAAFVRGDETEALGVVKPFDNTTCNFKLLTILLRFSDG